MNSRNAMPPRSLSSANADTITGDAGSRFARCSDRKSATGWPPPNVAILPALTSSMPRPSRSTIASMVRAATWLDAKKRDARDSVPCRNRMMMSARMPPIVPTASTSSTNRYTPHDPSSGHPPAGLNVWMYASNHTSTPKRKPTMTSQCATLTTGRPLKCVCPNTSMTTRDARCSGLSVRHPAGSGCPARTKLYIFQPARRNSSQAGRERTTPRTPSTIVVVEMAWSTGIMCPV